VLLDAVGREMQHLYGAYDTVARGPKVLVDAPDLDEALFERHLSTAGAPAPDVIVRTSGEQRISNFLLWECAYAELVYQDVLWPDYGPEHLAAALTEYRSRDRRYGGIAVDDVAVAG